ncbi:hypothetical protein HMPREF9566_00250 [Cutibacterium acnes HL045PA1]|nr:hypothetical protein HMPREF9566_00250 [Cutibacterium acnes HL045PA1]
MVRRVGVAGRCWVMSTTFRCVRWPETGRTRRLVVDGRPHG